MTPYSLSSPKIRRSMGRTVTPDPEPAGLLLRSFDLLDRVVGVFDRRYTVNRIAVPSCCCATVATSSAWTTATTG